MEFRLQKEMMRLSLPWFALNMAYSSLALVVVPSGYAVLPQKEAALLTGLTLSAGGTVALVTPLVAGSVFDRISRSGASKSRFAGISAAVGISGILLLSSVDWLNYSYVAVVYYVIAVIGLNSYEAALSTLIPVQAPRSARGAGSGAMICLSLAGVGVGYTISTALLSVLSAKMTCASLGFITALMLGCWTVNWKDENGPQSEQASIQGRRTSNLPTHYIFVWLSRLTAMTALYGVAPFLLSYIRTITDSQTAILHAILFACICGTAAIISTIVFGALSDKHGRLPVSLSGLIVLFTGLLVLAILGNLYGLLGSAFLLGTGYGAFASSNWAHGTDFIPDDHVAAMTMAKWQVAQNTGQVLGPLLTGYVLSHYISTETSREAYLVSILVLSIFVLVSAIAQVIVIGGGKRRSMR